jgi:DNA-binding SARP family transcriptional activator
MRCQILGPLRLRRDGVEVDPGARQQAYLLALLLAREGQPVSTTELIDLIWGDDVPATALNIIHKYIGALRRLLEPELPPRSTGSYLLRRGGSYLFVAGLGMLDLADFRELVEAAKVYEAEQRHPEALDRYLEALELWQGPAGLEWDDRSAATPTFRALDGEFFDACVAAADLAVSLGQPKRTLQHLHRAAAMAPLHEGVQASLITTLAAAGRQAEALASYRTVRTRLATNLGIDPGPALQTTHRQVLRLPAAGGLVGRTDELALLRYTVDAAFAGGAGLAIVQGEPGVGKSRLLDEITTEAGGRGARVLWGRCLQGDGTPSMWPWIQAIGTLLDDLAPAAREIWLGRELGVLLEPGGAGLPLRVLPDSGVQFRLFEQVVGLLAAASAQQPMVLAIDDLQWADTASLHLFSHLARRLPGRTVIIGALRDRAPAPGPELSRMLAAASRVPGHQRIRLGNLSLAEVTELIQRETGEQPAPVDTRNIHARTAGNPFFVRELSRLLADRAHTETPATVQDIVRDRMAALDDNGRELLQIAALIGRDVDLSLLARAAGLDIPACLDLLDTLDALALLEPNPQSPFSFRFVHDLVQESIAGAIPPSRIPRLHLRIADAMERVDPERLAHHLWAAGPLAEPSRVAPALVRAGRHAAAKSALTAAERHLRSAARVARNAGLAELELSALSLLTAVIGMRTMYGFSSPDLLRRAEELARGLGRELEATEFLYSRRAGHSQAVQLDQSGPLARRVLEEGEASADPIMRAYGLHSWGIHQWDVGNIGEAYRYLSQLNQIMLADLPKREENRLRHDLQQLSPVMFAMMTALHGDVDAARDLLDAVEVAAGDDPYAITVWAAFASTTAALAGDPSWAMRAAQRGITYDPQFAFVYLGTYTRLARCWAEALTGTDPAGAGVEAERIITTYLVDPPLSGVSNWYALLGEMWLAAGRPELAAAALGRAEKFLNVTGQRYAEGLLLLLRARLRLAVGEPAAAVRAASEQARTLSLERGAHLFVQRVDAFLAGLADQTPNPTTPR